MAINQIIAGAQNQTDSTFFNARGGRQGDTIVSELHGPHYEQAFRGNLFSICTQGTGVTTTSALATTWTGLGISNPLGSGVNLVLLKFQAAQFAVGAAATIGIMGGVGVLSASLTPQSRKIGSGTTSVARGSASDTISTPLLIATFGQVGSLPTTGYGLTPGLTIDVGGAIIVPPGSFIASYTALINTSALQFNFMWEEVPI